MATSAYYTWVAAGRHFRLATPIAELQSWANANDVAVLGTIGNEEHLQAARPQDHTPFSFTAWPVPLPGYVVTAIDLANVRGLGQAIEDQARAGALPWLKYMNHSGQHLDSRDLDGDGLTWEEYPSSDQHVHLSIRTDWISRSIGAFNPFAPQGQSGDNMFCNHGETNGNVMVMQLEVNEVLADMGVPEGEHLIADGQYGDRTAAALLRIGCGNPGNGGRVYWVGEYRALTGRLREIAAKRFSKPGPPGDQGIQGLKGDKGDKGDAAVIAPGVALRVVSA